MDELTELVPGKFGYNGILTVDLLAVLVNVLAVMHEGMKWVDAELWKRVEQERDSGVGKKEEDNFVVYFRQ